METIQEYFTCGECGNTYLKKVHRFSITLRKVNFSDELVYDKGIEECYECSNCKKMYTRGEIDLVIREIKHKWKGMKEE